MKEMERRWLGLLQLFLKMPHPNNQFVQRKLSWAGMLLLVATTAISGCGTDGEEKPGALDFTGVGGHGGQQAVIGFCEEDQSFTRDCTVYLEQSNGVTSCFPGIQYCDEGHWTDCLDPDHDPRVQ